MKITIANEEVLCSNNFTINQEMLNTPSVILNNVYPKSWELDKDYSSRFYHPNDYSQCKIFDEIPAEPGSTITNSNIIANIDNTKLYEYSLNGKSSQQITTGKNLFNKEMAYISGNLQNNGSVQTNDNYITYDFINLSDIGINNGESFTYSLINNYNTGTGTTRRFQIYDSDDEIVSTTSFASSTKGEILTQTYTKTSSMVKIRLSSRITDLNIQLEKGNSRTYYEPYTNGASPSPDYKQKIETVTGINNITITGKNELYLNEYTKDQNGLTGTFNGNTITINGTNTKTDANWSFMSRSGTGSNVKLPDFKAGETYCLSIDQTTNTQQFYIQLNYHKNGASSDTKLVQLNSNFPAAVFTIPNDFYDLGNFFIGIFKNATNIDISFNIQIEKGMIPTAFEEYKSNTFPINLGIKNLFDKTDYTEHLLIREDGTENPNATTTSSSNFIQVYPNTTYTESFVCEYNAGVFRVHLYDEDKNWIKQATSYTSTNTLERQKITFTTTSDTKYIRFTFRDSTNESSNAKDIQLEIGDTANDYVEFEEEPIELCKIDDNQDFIYKNNNNWYIEKNTEKLILNGTESWFTTSTTDNYYYFFTNTYDNLIDDTYNGICDTFNVRKSKMTKNTSVSIDTICIGGSEASKIRIKILKTRLSGSTTSIFKTWLENNNVTIYYIPNELSTVEITSNNLINQLNAVELYDGINNIVLGKGTMTLHYNFTEADEDIYFCGVVKNSGNISLNPRYPHYSTLQILDYKTFLSEGETLDFVIANKTILEAIEQVISVISGYGFELGNVDILGANEVIGAYSTKDKTAYDVFNYLADITQSRWTTRTVGVGKVAIDFYDPSLMPEGISIEYNQNWFCENKIIDMKYNYGTWDYRNKQVMTSQEILGSISQTQTIITDGYSKQYSVEQTIGQITSVTLNGIEQTIATNEQKSYGIDADIYYTPGNNNFNTNSIYSVGKVLIITYIPIVEGRQIINNITEIERVNEATGVKGVVSRYENRNDATTSLELQKIGQSYIKYKGVPEIKLTIKSQNNLWNIGDRVYFNAPIPELETEYMIKSKKINYVVTANEIFYDFELTSSFNSEQSINYFDNQRAKARGNIGEGEYITRNVDIESSANIIFFDNQIEEVTIVGDNTLNCALNSPLVN